MNKIKNEVHQQRLRQFADRIHSTPWAMEQSAMSRWISRMQVEVTVEEPTPLMPFVATSEHCIEGAKLDVERSSGAVVVVPLRGAIDQHRSWYADVSCDELNAVLAGLVSDDKVGAVVLQWDSPGGNVCGVPEQADIIRSYRGTKPIYSISDASMYSAAYWLGGAAGKVFVTPSGGAGSIGVWTAHMDVSKAFAEMGVDVSLISAGQYKVEGNPFEPLGDEARENMQSEVDAYYDMFVDAVAKNRGKRSSTVRAGFGQGRCVMAAPAAEEGMVDGVCTLSQLLGAIVPRQKRGMTRAEADLIVELEEAG